MYLVEICCTGNNGRSPMAEVIANKILEENGFEGHIGVISTGTRADPQWDNVLPYQKVVSIYSKALRSGLVKKAEIDKEKYEHDEEYRKATQATVRELLGIMRPIEAALRDAALLDAGLKYQGRRSQTIPRDDVDMLLGMEEKHATHAKQIYAGKAHPPRIGTILKDVSDSGISTDWEYVRTREEFTDFSKECASFPENIPDCLGSLSVEPYIEVRKILERALPIIIQDIELILFG